VKSKDLSAREGDAATGEALIKALHFQPWAEKLAQRAKYTRGGLQALLLHPAQHALHTTFPNLRLKPQEAADIAAWIESKTPKSKTATPGDAVKGKALVAQRCATCHEPGKGVKYDFPAKGLKEMWNTEWLEHGCLSEEEGQAPELGLSLEQKQALFAFKNIDGNKNYTSLRRFVPHEYAARTVERFQCNSCHSGTNKLPKIDLAGEKFHSDWLHSLFKGESLKVRPWMTARMPSFAAHADALTKGLAFQAGMDLSTSKFECDPDLVATGKEITSVTGYACTTCHAAGATPALQAFEGQGPNLQLASDRLRPGFYRTWMFWPQRHAPLTIMPKYTIDKEKALNANFYNGDADKQFEAIRHYMRSLTGAEQAPVPEKK
jgi:mono/diheme cytochrome c family protein